MALRGTICGAIMFRMENVSFAGMNDSSGVPAVGRIARILEELASADVALGVSEMARRTGLSKSTVHGTMAALVREGYLTSVDAGKGYVLGPELARLGGRARDQRVLAAAQGALGRACEPGEATVLFGRVEGGRVIILARRESSDPLHLSAPLGSRVPLTAGALGRAFLASLAEAEADVYLCRHPLAPHTDRSIVDPAVYRDEVARVRRVGFAAERGEYLSGVVAAASALSWSDETYLVWAIALDGRVDDGELQRMGLATRDIAAKISQVLSVESGDARRSAS